jgi:hypothetical protein
MKKFSLLLFCIFPYIIKAQIPLYYQSNYIRVVQPDFNDPNLKFDTLANPFTGGMNNPVFFNIDYNGDGIQDLFVFDRDLRENQFLNFEALSKNSISYHFTPKYESAFPNDLNYWASLADYNQDGLPDIFTHSIINSTGLKVYKNTSYIDPVTKKFTLRYQFFKEALYKYDSLNNPGQISVPWASNPYLIDMDKDGFVDILSLDISLNSIQYYRNRGINKDSLEFYYTKACWGYFEETLPHLYTPWSCNNFVEYDPKHYKSAAHTYSAICALDAEGDGDIDLLIGDGGNDSLAFLQNGRDKYKKDTITNISFKYNNNNFPIDDPAIIHQMPIPSVVDVNNDGLQDLIIAAGQPTEGDTLTQSTRISNVWYYQNGGNATTPIYLINKKNFLQNTMVDWGVNSAPCFIDVDKDGRKDLVMAVRDGGGKKGYSHLILYLNKAGKSGSKPYLLYQDRDYLGFSQLAVPIRRPVPAAYQNGKDSKTDLIIGNDSGRIMYFKDESSGTNPASFKLAASSLMYKTGTGFKPIDVGTNSSPTSADINKDGMTDLLIGANDGRISYYRCLGYGPAPDYIPYFQLVTNVFGGINSGGKDFQSAPCIADLNHNGKPDLLLGDIYGQLLYYPDFDTTSKLTAASGSLVYDYRTSAPSAGRLFSTYTIPAVSYLDNDSIPDIMLGCRRGGLIFLGSKNNGFETIGHTGIDDYVAPEGMNIEIFPNPARDNFVLKYANTTMMHDAAIEVRDMLGRVVLLKNIPLQPGNGQVQNETTELHNGIYIVNVNADNKVLSGKKIIIRK